MNHGIKIIFIAFFICIAFFVSSCDPCIGLADGPPPYVGCSFDLDTSIGNYNSRDRNKIVVYKKNRYQEPVNYNWLDSWQIDTIKNSAVSINVSIKSMNNTDSTIVFYPAMNKKFVFCNAEWINSARDKKCRKTRLNTFIEVNKTQIDLENNSSASLEFAVSNFKILARK